MAQRIQNIVVGMEDPGYDDPILTMAAALAERLGARLHAVHASDAREVIRPTARIAPLVPGLEQQHVDALRGRVLNRALRTGGQARVQGHVRIGAPDSVLAAVARETSADLVVVGASRKWTLGQRLLGTTAQRVIRTSPVPILVVRKSVLAPMQRVLLATDLSDLSAATHEVGLDMVEQLAGSAVPELRSLMVAWPDSGVPTPLRHRHGVESAQADLAAFLRERRPRGRAVEGVVRSGKPAQMISAEASEWGADLLVIGTHGRRGASRLLLGSISELAALESPCNVLVIPGRAAAADERFFLFPAVALAPLA